MCEGGVDHDAHRRVVVGTARHDLTRFFELALAFVGDLEAGSTAHLYHIVCTGVAIPSFWSD
ncbi:hypothetical protein C473_11099 [Halorubrum distributum JCM 10247]|uniref:Uncharacterized protein n=1 Tax=Halorubrum distributum JCM 10247 TaxID=1227486 RepID=M0DBR8_9EURY|nr:hypothetical protein C473_11099 [Halorubrum terrestre JCM 10247]